MLSRQHGAHIQMSDADLFSCHLLSICFLRNGKHDIIVVHDGKSPEVSGSAAQQ